MLFIAISTFSCMSLLVLSGYIPSSALNPFRTAVPFRGQTSQISSSFVPKRDCGSKRVNTAVLLVVLGHLLFCWRLSKCTASNRLNELRVPSPYSSCVFMNSFRAIRFITILHVSSSCCQGASLVRTAPILPTRDLPFPNTFATCVIPRAVL